MKKKQNAAGLDTTRFLPKYKSSDHIPFMDRCDFVHPAEWVSDHPRSVRNAITFESALWIAAASLCHGMKPFLASDCVTVLVVATVFVFLL